MSAREPDGGGPPPVPGMRSEAERERARAEREARRAGRGGAPAGGSPRAAAPRAGREEAGQGAQATGPGAGARAADGASAALRGARERLRAARERGRDGDAGGPAASGPGAGAAPGLGRGTAAGPAAGGDGPGGRRRVARRIPVLAGLGLAAVLLIWGVLFLFQPFAGDGDEPVRVTIRQGAGVSGIAKALDEQGVISSAAIFELRARLGGHGGDLQAGTYTLRKGMSYGAALDALSAGPPKDVVTVSIPEGRSRREIAPAVRASGVEGDYVRASRRSRRFDPREYGAKAGSSLEGFLFPATYELKKGASAAQLVEEQLAAFKQRWAEVDLRYAEDKLQLTPYDVLIVASMVERETAVDRERGLIASVIYNRLREGIPLGIDATTRYAVNNWTRPLRQSELASPSPYNTRNRQGLPPGPIGNPGIESMRAAAKPPRTGFLFYVAKVCGNGTHEFAKTDAEFQRFVARYNAEREKRGGQSPTDC